ncbi:MAG TPA: hypothetical protein VFZ21_31015 [Gemmatimonadaceae bacterium]|nr:hypothetical protein [Gemmatimonadaceae bacterium]
MTSAERTRFEAKAAEWLERAKEREPSVAQTYRTCAEQLLAMLKPRKRVRKHANGAAT